MEDGPNRTLIVTNATTENIAVFGNQILSTIKYDVDSIAVFPNPASGILNINQHNTFSKVSIYNIDGRLLQSFNFDEGNLKIDLGHLPSGLYLLQLESEHQSPIAKKILKQ